MRRLFLLFIVIFLLYTTIAFAISNVDCDTSNNGGNTLCKYNGYYKPNKGYFENIKGDNNPSTLEEQNSFGTSGFLTDLPDAPEIVTGVDVSFGGGGMDYYGESCDSPSHGENCPTGVNVKLVKIECYNANGLESTPFNKDPCPDDACKFIVTHKTTTPRQLTKSKCNFLSTTPLGSYTVKYYMTMDYYDSHVRGLDTSNEFIFTKGYTLECTNYKGCTNGETCVSGGTKTNCVCVEQEGCEACFQRDAGSHCDCNVECASNLCVSGTCRAECQCTTYGGCCDGCSFIVSNDPIDKSDEPRGEFYCEGKDRYQYYTDWYCDGTSAEPKSRIVGRFKETCPELCQNGACKAACTDECTTIGKYCEGNKLITCSLGADGCKDRSEQTCPEGKGCWDKACRPYKMKILFLPVNWGTGETKFNQSAQQQANFFRDHLPTECGDEIGTYWKFTNCIIQNEDSFCGRCTPFFGDAGHALDQLKDCANKEHYEYNYIVGLLDHYHVCPDGSLVVGYNCNKKQVVIATKFDEMTSSHELGHVFGLNDEYNKFIANKKGSPNPLSIEYGCDSSSNCKGELCCCGVERGVHVLTNCTSKDDTLPCCLGNKHDGGRSIMSFSDLPNDFSMIPRAFEKSCLDRIKGDKGLKCT